MQTAPVKRNSTPLGTGAKDRAGQERAKPLHVCHLVGWEQPDMGCPETARTHLCLRNSGGPVQPPDALWCRRDSEVNQHLAKHPADESPALGEHGWGQHPSGQGGCANVVRAKNPPQAARVVVSSQHHKLGGSGICRRAGRLCRGIRTGWIDGPRPTA